MPKLLKKTNCAHSTQKTNHLVFITSSPLFPSVAVTRPCAKRNSDTLHRRFPFPRSLLCCAWQKGTWCWRWCWCAHANVCREDDSEHQPRPLGWDRHDFFIRGVYLFGCFV